MRLKIPNNTLFNDINEWHSFVIGWSEAICFWKCKFPMPKDYENPLEKEYHYYVAGRAIGFICLLVIILGGIIWLKH